MNEGAAWFRRALDADTDAPRELRAQALHWLGVMLDEQRDERGAIDRLEEALAIQREIGDERLIARELNSLGAVHRNIGEQGSARSLLMESLARRRRLGDMAGVATVLTNLGIVALDRGDPDSAIEPLEEALAIDRASGATGGSAYSSIALGTAYLRTGRVTSRSTSSIGTGRLPRPRRHGRCRRRPRATRRGVLGGPAGAGGAPAPRGEFDP